MKTQAELQTMNLSRRRSLEKDEIAEIRGQYPIVDKCVFWDCAAVSPISTGVRDAIARQAQLQCADIRDAVDAAATVKQRGRDLAARLVGASADQISYVQNTSHGMSLVALGIRWTGGDNIVVPELEFPSNFLAWEALALKGVEVRKLRARDGALWVEDLKELVDWRTRLVAVSQVQFYSGFRVDLAAFAEVCSAHDALLVVDGTQSIGVLGLDMRKEGVDVLVASAHKWMLGPLGIGFMAMSERAAERVEPRVIGWLSVNDPFSFQRKLDFLPDGRRFEPGTENAPGIFGLTRRLEEIDRIGQDRIENYVLSLGELIRESLRSADFEIASDWESASQAGIILCRSRTVATDTVFERLREAGMRSSVRNGAIRFSPHYFNDEAEVRSVVDVLTST